jgi:hypothetical protein
MAREAREIVRGDSVTNNALLTRYNRLRVPLSLELIEFPTSQWNSKIDDFGIESSAGRSEIEVFREPAVNKIRLG